MNENFFFCQGQQVVCLLCGAADVGSEPPEPPGMMPTGGDSLPEVEDGGPSNAVTCNHKRCA